MSSPRNKSAAAIFLVSLMMAAGSPASAPDLLDRALSSLDLMAYEEAVSLFDRILADEYKREGVRPYLAYAYDRLGRTDQAVLVLDTELRIRPEEIKSLSLMAFLHGKAGRVEEAERFAQAFDAVYEKTKNKPKTPAAALKAFGPNAGIPAYVLGVAAGKKGDSESARAWFIKAWNLGYLPQACWLGAIDAQIRGEKWTEALRLCQAGGNLAPAQKSERPPGKNPKADKPPFLATPAEVFLRLGYVLAKLERPFESLRALQTAAALRPFDANILKSLAIAHANRGDIVSAERFFIRALELSPLDFEAMSLLDEAKSGRLRTFSSDVVSAPIPLPAAFLREDGLRFQYVFRDDPKDVAGKVNGYAIQLVRDGSLPEAHLLLRSFTEIFNNSPTVFFNLGLLANSLDHRAEALESAIRAIALDSEYRDAYDLAANVCFKIRDFGASAAFYEEAVRLDPEDPISHYNLGLALSEKGETCQAEARFKEAIRLEKASPVAGALSEVETSELKRAVTITVEPISAPAYQALGNLAITRGAKDEALAWFVQSAEFNPKNPGPYLEIGKIYLDRGDKDRAEDFFKKFLSAGGDKSRLEGIWIKRSH